MSVYDAIWNFLHDQGYMPHGMCLLWNPTVFWAHAVSDAVIALSYFSIPLALGTFAAKRRDLEYRWVIVMFTAFVAACGVTHLFGVWVLWVPSYGWEALAKLVTAAVSAFTAIALWPLMPHALALPSRTQLSAQNHLLAEEIVRRQQAEAQLRELNRHLEDKVHQRTLQLERANAELSRAMEEAQSANRAKSDFLAVMSHEVRTPLNAVLGLNRLLKRSVLTETQERYVDSINSAGQMLLSLLNDILDFSKIEAGRLDLDESPVDLHQCVREVVTLFDNEAKGKGLHLTLDIGANVPRAVQTDAVRVRQILYNLVSNAVKFTEAGEVGVSVQACPADAEGDAGAGAGDAGAAPTWLLTFAVSDTGPGIAPEKKQALFDRFVQLDVTISRRYGGTGLGLAICKRLVELMGGRIECRSTVGVGSTFRVDLPCRHGVLPEDADQTATDPSAQPAPAKLLVAEDAELNRMLLAELLAPHGHDLTFVHSGAAAVAAVEDAVFDAILMDVYMPEMDGLEATRRIRNLPDPIRRDTPIIGLTAGVLDEQLRACRRAGMDWCLPKPLELQRLLVALARHSRAGSLDAQAEAAAPSHGNAATNGTETTGWRSLQSATPDDLGVLFDHTKARELNDALGAEKAFAMYREFIATCDDLVRRLERSDGPPAALAHTLAGMAGNFGALRLCHLANRVHLKALQGSDTEPDIAGLRALLGETNATIRSHWA